MTTTRAPRVRGVLAAALFVLVTLLAGCGDDDGTTATDPGSEPTVSDTASATASDVADESPTESETPKAPQCADVWVDGAKLPGGYQDCYDGDARVKADGRYCEFGKMLITYDDQLLGGARPAPSPRSRASCSTTRATATRSTSAAADRRVRSRGSGSPGSRLVGSPTRGTSPSRARAARRGGSAVSLLRTSR